jgi:ABC-type glycerol-3-phosphate transport system permease component
VKVRLGLATGLLILGAFLFMAPLYAMLVMALKTPQEISSTGPWTLPSAPSLENLRFVLSSTDVRFSLLFANSALIATLSTLGTIITAAMAAYAFSRLRFRGRDRLFLLILATMMLPGIIVAIPSYILFAKLGWVNTQLPLWVPAWLGGGAFNVFLLRQFFLGIPREIDEAARLDGAGHGIIFLRLILPLSRPALATVATLTFVGSWTDFFGPLLYISDRNLMPLELGLRTFQSQRGTQWNYLMAATLIAMVPIVVVFLVGQRYFVRGISLTGGK